MQDQRLPSDLQEFLAKQINSVVQLELLLLLRASAPRAWTAEEIARELRIDTNWAASQADDLCSRNLLQCTREGATQYRYEPSSAALHTSVQKLAGAYVDRRVSIISFIYSKPIDPLRAFADAFRLRKDTPNG